MDEKAKEELLLKRARPPKWLFFILLLLMIAGIVTFISGVVGPHAKEAWQIYLVNFLFWAGVAQAGVVFSCALRITSGRWGRPLLRISEAFSSFIPVSFVLLLVLFLGREYILPYATEHYHHPKDIWLSIPFVFARNVIGIFILSVLSLIYVYYSLRQDLGEVKDRLSGICGWIASDWKGEEDKRRCWDRLSKLAPAIALIYALTFSIIAWDFIMSLDPHWYSTLFGPFYFVASFVAALGATIILSSFVRRYLGLQDYITQFQFYDIGKLLLGFSMFWVYLMFSQFLPIWYGNMPEETVFVIKRVKEEPFRTLSWVVISCCFFFPFVTLLPRTNKVIPPILAFIASVSFVGFWLEKFVLVTPSLSHGIEFGLMQLLITLGFFATFVFMFLVFIKTFPVLPVGDPLFPGKGDSGHSGGH
ncbi:MAG: membrane protein [Deltaproteobacteria bacterium]|nr:MAG: membrane protein [Deltaproteobacteria bacterium]